MLMDARMRRVIVAVGHVDKMKVHAFIVLSCQDGSLEPIRRVKEAFFGPIMRRAIRAVEIIDSFCHAPVLFARSWGCIACLDSNFFVRFLQQRNNIDITSAGC